VQKKLKQLSYGKKTPGEVLFVGTAKVAKNTHEQWVLSGDRKTIQIMAANYWQHEQANSLFLEPEVRSIGHLALVEDMPAVAA
jgi:hypothetical protein